MNDKEIHSVEVVIAGEIITLTGEESEDYILKIARYLDVKIREMQKIKKVLGINSFMKYLLVAINVTDDLFKTREKLDFAMSECDTIKQENNSLKLKNENYTEQILQLQAQLKHTQQELDAYIDTFDKNENKSRL